MEHEITLFDKRCSTCQLEKGVRINRQCEGIILDTPINPNDTITIEIFGHMPSSARGYEYILSIQDQLINGGSLSK